MTVNELSKEDFDLLRDSANRFFSEQLPVAKMREIRDQQHAQGFDTELWQGMVGMGWSGVLVSEDQGGLGMGHRSMGIIMEAAGHTLAATPLLSTAVIGTGLLQKLGSADQQAAYLPGIIDGGLITALAIEEHRRHRPDSIATTAKRDGERFVLNGRKTFVLDGHVADRLFILARTGAIKTRQQV